MRSLRERLAAIHAIHATTERPAASAPPGVPIDVVAPGETIQTEAGPFHVVEHRDDDSAVAALLERAPLSVGLYLRDRRHDDVSAEEILFLDTETTGLAGGTGTHAFLIGLGSLERGALVVRQVFMPHPAGERAVLAYLREVLPRYRLLVTFNGKSFDWPLIETRLILHGYRLRLGHDHLDLLHPARRIWRHRLPNCSLGSLEEALFGVTRVDDVPGFLIPQLYFDYLRDGDARRLAPVFSHNRQDILAMVRLADLLLRAADSPPDALHHPADLAGLGLLLLDRGEEVRALQVLAAALDRAEALPAQLRQRVEVELSRGLKRVGRSAEAVPLWVAMCERAARSRPLDLYPFEMLAKYYEHERRDPAAAERVVERALTLLAVRGERPPADLLHRFARLRRKQSLQQAHPPRERQG